MAFATVDDVAVRLGRALTEAEAAMAEQIIANVTGQIADAVDEGAEWASELDPVPAALTVLCVDKVMAVGSNPNNLASETEELGAYRNTRTFSGGGAGSGGPMLTKEDKRIVRRAIHGPALRSMTMETPYSGSSADELPDLPL